jgi:hypothetical protein
LAASFVTCTYGTHTQSISSVPTISLMLSTRLASYTPTIQACRYIDFGHVTMQTRSLIFECIVGEALIATCTQALNRVAPSAWPGEVFIFLKLSLQLYAPQYQLSTLDAAET